MNINPFLLTDFYKVGHVFQYPPGTSEVYSNLTPRSSRLPGVDKLVFFGLQYFVQKYLIDYFDENFFSRKLGEVMDEYKSVILSSLGGPLASYTHIERIHDLGYLPLKIKAVPEGTRVPMRVPCMTLVNSGQDAWLTNWLESLLSTMIWQPCTSATIAYEYYKIFSHYAAETGMPPEFVKWQGHDFSFRGMSSLESSISSSMAHLLPFTGTDTIPAICALSKYYDAQPGELIGGSIPATEHSVMCAGGDDNEYETIKRLITEVYPAGPVSIVSDTWNLWRVLTEILPRLKAEIMARPGKVVVRPDSGDPVKIMCGNPEGKSEAERKGVIELLWDAFGGTTTSRGYKLLDQHVGAIYGDSITLDRGRSICAGLAAKGFASQSVLGIGSYTYQFNTRDTFGLAMKATSVVIHGERRAIYKNPVTDDGTKRSARGLLKVEKRDGTLFLQDDVTPAEEETGLLTTVFLNGKLVKRQTLSEIRNRLLLNTTS